MKHIVADYALAHSVLDCDGTELQVYEASNGGMFALDGAFLDEECEDPLYIQSPFDKGKAIQLVDSLDEINKSTVCGDEHPSELIDSAITQIIGDIKAYDLTALSELLQFLPEECLKNYIG
jgi:hypothetical protein